jgi:uncharacterized membrane protein
MTQELGLFFAALSLVGLGLYPVFLKKVVERLGEYTCMLFNQLVLALAIAVAAVFTIRLTLPSDFVIVTVIFAALINAFTLYIYYNAINAGQVSLVAALAATSGVLVVFLSYMLFGESVYPHHFLGVLLVLVGVALAAIEHFLIPKKLDEHALFELFSSKVWYPAAGLAILASLCTVFSAMMMKYSAGGIGPHKSMVYVQIITLAFLLFAFLAKPAKELVTWPGKGEWKWLLPCGLLLSAGIIGGYFAITQIETQNAAMIAAFAPLLAVIMSAILLKERLKARQYIGLLMAVAGIVLLAM